jgi:hypothetical protein
LTCVLQIAERVVGELEIQYGAHNFESGFLLVVGLAVGCATIEDRLRFYGSPAQTR